MRLIDSDKHSTSIPGKTKNKLPPTTIYSHKFITRGPPPTDKPNNKLGEIVDDDDNDDAKGDVLQLSFYYY